MSASPVSDDNLFVWNASVMGPDESPWEGEMKAPRTWNAALSKFAASFLSRMGRYYDHFKRRGDIFIAPDIS